MTVNVGEYGIIDISFKSESDIYITAETKRQAQGVFSGNYCIVAFSNGTDYQLIKDKDNNLSDFKAANSDYEPIGILVIPSSCTSIMLPDGDVRKGKNIIMSLRSMSATAPDTGNTGSDVTKIFWSNTYDYPTALTDYNIMNYYSDAATQSTISTTSKSVYLPTDYDYCKGDVESKDYPSTYYATVDTRYFCYVPSPFIQVDGELLPNEKYYTTAYSSQNAFSDFAGPNNTKVLIDLATAQTDWKTKGVAIANSNQNHNISGYYPAACCCARFGAPDNSSAPKGTNSFLYHYNNNPSYDYTKGVNYTWYFPAMGELGFVLPRLQKISNTLYKLRILYDDDGMYYTTSTIWTSTVTKNYSYDAYALYMSYCRISFSPVKNSYNIVAFCAI